MDDESGYSEEGMVFSEIIQDLMLVNGACRTLVDARSEALLELVSAIYREQPSGATRPTAEALRRFVDNRAKEILNVKLATLADDNPDLVSEIARMLKDFLPNAE